MLHHLFLIAVFFRAALSEYAAPSANHVNAIKELLQDALGEERNFIPTCVRLGKKMKVFTPWPCRIKVFDE